MYIVFMTKRDKNGNRYFLTVDPVANTFSRLFRWYNPEYITITKRDMKKLYGQLIAAGFCEKDFY